MLENTLACQLWHVGRLRINSQQNVQLEIEWIEFQELPTGGVSLIPIELTQDSNFHIDDII